MNRRGFLSSILALAAAPAIVRADSLMRIVPREFVGIDLSAAPSMTGLVRATRMFDIARDVIVERLDIFDGITHWCVHVTHDGGASPDRTRVGALATLEQKWRDNGCRPLQQLPLVPDMSGGYL